MLLFHCSSVETFVSRDNSLLKLDDHCHLTIIPNLLSINITEKKIF
nr:Bm768 [Brugia malayi]CDQ01429.1 Bm777 [Brugia malayi]CDQ01569.1 Bm912 [Brugia malayi]CDQ01574.1 Bm917 [Brugia malayi]CDQ01576.1 Bm919 [Brugia malayi]